MGFVLFTFSGLLYEFHDVPCHLSSHGWTSACCAFETKWCHLQPSVHHAWSPISASTTALTQNHWPQWFWTTLDDSGVNYGKLVIINHSRAARAFQNYHSGWIWIKPAAKSGRFFCWLNSFAVLFERARPGKPLALVVSRFRRHTAIPLPWLGLWRDLWLVKEGAAGADVPIWSDLLFACLQCFFFGGGRCFFLDGRLCAINGSSTAGLGEGNHRINRTKPTQSICTHIIGWHEFGYIG